MISGRSVIKNLSWKFSERVAAQIVTFVVSIVLARIIAPSDYGVVSLVIVFITIANVFVSDGLGSALIQKKEADALDFSSALYFNILFSVVLYLLLFVTAPFIADFFGEGYEILSPILRVLGLRIIIAAVNSIQGAYVARKMMFEKFFWATLWGTVASAAVGIWMAYHDFGAWALVGQNLTNATVGTMILAMALHKRPLFSFSFARVRILFDYGIKILGSGLLIALYTEARSFIIGKVYTPADLAFYDRARQFPALFMNSLVATINAVLLPKMASEQDDISQLKATTKQAIRFTSFLIFPLMFGLAAVSEPLVRMLLTEKWIACVPLIQFLCISYLWQPIHAANLQAIKAVGRSDTILKLEIIKKIIETVVLICVMYISVNAIIVSMAVNSSLFVLLNAYPNRTLLHYSIREQLIDMSVPFIMSAIMAGVIWFIRFIPMRDVFLLSGQTVVGGVLYFFLTKCVRLKELDVLVGFIRNFMVRNG